MKSMDSASSIWDFPNISEDNSGSGSAVDSAGTTVSSSDSGSSSSSSDGTGSTEAKQRIAYLMGSIDGISKILTQPSKSTWNNILVIIWKIAMLMVSLMLLSLGVVMRFFFTDLVQKDINSVDELSTYRTYVRLDKFPRPLEFSNVMNVVGLVLICLNFAYLAQTVFYMSFQVHKLRFTLPVCCAIVVVEIIISISVSNIYLAENSFANRREITNLIERLKNEYHVFSTDEFSVTYDIISIWLGCCGIRGQIDFNGIELHFKTALELPPTCCTRVAFQRGVTTIQKCLDGTVEMRYKEGCFTKLFSWIYIFSKKYHIIVFLRVADLVICILLYRRYLRFLLRRYELMIRIEDTKKKLAVKKLKEEGYLDRAEVMETDIDSADIDSDVLSI